MNKYLTAEEVLKLIEDLAKSQGLYCRLLESIREMEEFYPEHFESYKRALETQRFKDPVDVVMFFES